MNIEKTPRVGVGAVIKDDLDRILLVLRKRAPEAGHWSLPGGKVDYMETIEEAIRREIREELGIEIMIDGLLCVTNHILPEEDTHYVAPTFLAHIAAGRVENREPHALGDVQWFPINSMPDKITVTTAYALKHL
ncbi:MULTISPECIES: NUDIX domain-containing protein [unclassified Paenibacillus]|uniref:NUDIX domain-containing protein n=1 Tax=unclassified Paenibacillus TaxID=185978 RepID=UPI000839CFCE|nr:MULTISPECIES: NUDIX domain-containing protein [unclassified Paenibacillus]NWL87096.1 NUDIX domain-containing protein [Paenibacillus sp. 79R4]